MVAIGFAIAFGAAACAMRADGPVEHRRGAIVGGQLAGTCQWPSVVSFGGCDGVLLAPRVFATAAHCLRGGPPATVVAGDTRATPARSYAVESCQPDATASGCTIAGASGERPRSPVVPTLAVVSALIAALARRHAAISRGAGRRFTHPRSPKPVNEDETAVGRVQ